MLKGKDSALAFDRLVPHWSGGEYQNVPKDLFGKVSMFSGGAATNVGWVEERRNQNPRVLNDLFEFAKRKLDGDVCTWPDASELALGGPARK